MAIIAKYSYRRWFCWQKCTEIHKYPRQVDITLQLMANYYEPDQIGLDNPCCWLFEKNQQFPRENLKTSQHTAH